MVYSINSFLDLSLESSYIIGLFQEMFKARRPLKDEDQTNSEQSLRLKRDKGPGSRQVSEEKNKFALSVLRRVRVKLEGREPDSLRKVGNREICIMFNIHPKHLCIFVTFNFSVNGWRTSGLHYKRGDEHGKPVADVRRVDCVDLIG